MLRRNRFTRRPGWWWFPLTVGALAVAAGSLRSAEQSELFEQRIRPVLVEHCYECHSAQSNPPDGGLRLDSRTGVRVGGSSGPAVVPGEVEQSSLMQALRYRDEALQMPPDGKLPDAVIRDFETWIASGADDPRDGDPAGPPRAAASIDLTAGKRHWAFQPLQHSAPPVAGMDWSSDPLDRYIAEQLDQVGLAPAPRAEWRRLVRRLHFDLTGLPPTPAELEALCRDDEPVTWSRLVDQLLSTRAFAEHWARHWLDVVRYADSNGNDFNATYHEAWRFRNYVIDSFAADKPYDQFVCEQIAGDLLPYADAASRSEQLIATAFLTIGPKMLSERDKLKLRLDVIDEQIDTYGKSLLGLTIGCARCHDHKFDPIPIADYYALAGIFWNSELLNGEIQQYVSDWVEHELPISEEHARQLALHGRQTAALEAQIRELEERRSELQATVDRAALTHEGLVVDNGEAELKGHWIESRQVQRFVGRDYVHDGNEAKGEKSATYFATIPTAGRYELRLAYTPGETRATNVLVLIHHQNGIEQLLVNQRQPPQDDALFEPLGSYSFVAGTQPVVVVSNTATDGYVVVDAIQLVPLDHPDQVAGGAPDSQVDRAQLAELRRQLVELQDRSRHLKEELERVKRLAPPAPPRTMTVREAARPVDIELRVRGVPNSLGETIPRGFLRVMDEDGARLRDASQSGRLELADWTTRVAQPLLARVLVNRIWHHLIGAGLVRTCDDFGHRGEQPTHPELLDYLANELINHGWSVKHVIRRIVLSQTYQMQVVANGRAATIDPDNRWLWTARGKRLTAEQLRDAVLTVSGSLDRNAAQSPVPHYGRLINNNSANETEFVRHESFRRSIYLPVVRNELPDLLVGFDFADPDRVVGQRPETNVPAQALLLLNHPLLREAAERVARQLLNQPDDLTRLSTLYQLFFQREPRPADILRARAFLDATTAEIGEPSDATLLAWTRLCHALLASTEFRYLD